MLLTVATVVGVVRVTADSAPSAVPGAAPMQVAVDVDGVSSVVLTTAQHAPALGRQLGVGKLVAVRQAPTRLTDGSTVVFRTRKAGTLEVDGQLVPYDSPSLTIERAPPDRMPTSVRSSATNSCSAWDPRAPARLGLRSGTR